jgi:D-sedoheptulose 7-phosphate isomerase
MEYLDELNELVTKLNEIDFDNIAKNIVTSQRVYICGNGGSSSTASHIVNDLKKMCNIDACCLTDNVPLVTALANDVSYESIFSEQILRFGNEEDMLIVLTGSGNSKNLLHAIDVAILKNMMVIAFVGADGGEIKELYSDCIQVIHTESDMQHSEDLHLIIGHILCKMIANYF